MPSGMKYGAQPMQLWQSVQDKGKMGFPSLISRRSNTEIEPAAQSLRSGYQVAVRLSRLQKLD